MHLIEWCMREKLSSQITIRLEESADLNIRTIAANHGISAADLIRSAVLEKLADWETNGLHLKPTRKPRADFARATA